MLLIWKKYFTCVILLISSPRYAIITRLNVIYTKFRHVMITQLNKIWHVWACAHAIASHSWPGLLIINPNILVSFHSFLYWVKKNFFAKVKAGRVFAFAKIKFTSQRKLLFKIKFSKNLFQLIHNPNAIKSV